MHPSQRHATQFDVLQPPYKYPARAPPTRDRFRSRRKSEAVCGDDDVEDDEDLFAVGCVEGREMDSFDERLMQQPYPDRRNQAELGRARLSFAPEKTYRPAASSWEHEIPHGEQHFHRQDHGHFPGQVTQPFRRQFSQFAYNGIGNPETSSDAQPDLSSSPALRAGQRRATHYDTSKIHAPPRFQTHLNDPRNREAEGYGDLGYEDEMDDSASTYFTQQNDFSRQQPRKIQDSSQANQIDRQPKPRPSQKGPPVCQGIQLVPVSSLPDRLRTVFPYPIFNAVQSKCFNHIFKSDDNFVLASPTGSGKTVILELAVCRAIATNATGQYKVVYQAPTKALCSERQRDWEAKFTPLGLKCAELTGDSDVADLRNVQSANIIITTPEKWDSITRKWKDNEKLMRLVRVFLIDEVHILKEDRGAVLEAVVSRMKSIGTTVRFVALSATVPNFQDVATWLGKNSAEPYTPAANEKFGEEFRPVKLQKHVCGYPGYNNSEFSFEKFLDSKLPDVISKYSEGKPVMIFCATRNSCISTAKMIATWWKSRPGREQFWSAPINNTAVRNKDLRETLTCGVVFHHAGVEPDDRLKIEQGYLSRDISVICCTSTLAVGVNLPCHLVIIKNTMAYTNHGMQEYSDLEMMQMLGRAGRPQHDHSAVAVIMTRQHKIQRYEKMVTGQDLLESKLHLNLIAHVNAEIGLGTIRDLLSARKWLTGTFLYVRLQHNPTHYKLQGARSGQNIEEQVDDICSRDIELLREHNLVSGDEYVRCTEFGHAMARYYVQFETMRKFMGLQSKASLSEILSAISQASEFDNLRLRAGEKPVYKMMNKAPSIRFPIPVNIDLPAHKVSLIIQTVLGCADVSWDGEIAKHRSQYTLDTQIVFKNISSLIRCIIDCQISLGDSVTIHNALMIERSLGSRIWDDTPMQLKQVEGIGNVGVRKLVNAGIRSIEDLESCEAHRIEALIGRNPPFGMKVLESAHSFPKLRISLHAQPTSAEKSQDGVKVQVKADIGFLSERPPLRFAGKLVYVCVLVDTSDGRKVHFARISGQKLGAGQTLVFPALLTSPDQSINCYVMCDSIAGSMRGATVKPQVAPSLFPAPKPPEPEVQQQPNTSRRRTETARPTRRPSTTSDDFDDDGIDDEALVKASFGDLDFEHIENFANPADVITRKNTAKNKSVQSKAKTAAVDSLSNENDQDPVQLPNGKWACSHRCKDKNACRHLCCKEGMDKPSKKATNTKGKSTPGDEAGFSQSQPVKQPKTSQTKLQVTVTKRKTSANIEELDLTQQEKKIKPTPLSQKPKDVRNLHQLHRATQKKDLPSTLHSVMHKKPAYCYSQGGDHNLSFMTQENTRVSEASSDYGDLQFDDYAPRFDQPSAYYEECVPESVTQEVEQYIGNPEADPALSCRSDTFGDDDSILAAAMVGLADSQGLQNCSDFEQEAMDTRDAASDFDFESDFHDDEFPMDVDKETPAQHVSTSKGKGHARDIPSNEQTKKARGPFLDATSDLCDYDDAAKSGERVCKDMELNDPTAPLVSSRYDPDKVAEDKENVLDVLDLFDEEPIKEEREVPDAFKGLEPWLFQEFGDVVELVDD